VIISEINQLKLDTNGASPPPDAPISNGQQDELAILAARFSRCDPTLRVIASRVLESSERVDDAITNCWLAASDNPPVFEHEGAFRSWLLRVLIDEALVIRPKDKERAR
jgi:DNA-directed RNA polymerase specialized sigma24 family protein